MRLLEVGVDRGAGAVETRLHGGGAEAEGVGYFAT
jgi:hypothetical protein